jgi:mono/diheme cytochrome c family protein
MQVWITAILLIGSSVAVSAQAPTAPEPAALSPAQLAAFPAGEGREVTVRVCSGCHAPEVITQQRMAPADWARIVEMMAGQGAQGSDADFEAITAYLNKAFAVE